MCVLRESGKKYRRAVGDLSTLSLPCRVRWFDPLHANPNNWYMFPEPPN